MQCCANTLHITDIHADSIGRCTWVEFVNWYIDTHTYIFVSKGMLIGEEALQPEDRDVADERKRVLECQPVVESMVGSPLILQELTKVSIKLHSSFCSMFMSITVGQIVL